jgi:hypothetical protein
MARPRQIDSLFMRKGIGRLSATRVGCSGCSRTLLPGERIHRFETGRELCELCLARLPAHKPGPVSSERVLVTERMLRIARPV